jgi:hypothetical protein
MFAWPAGGIEAGSRRYWIDLILANEQAVISPWQGHTMTFQPHRTGLRIAAVLLGFYGVLWIALEGNLWIDLLLSAWLMAVAAWYLANRYLAGRTLPLARWLALLASLGLAFGAGLVLLILFFMALKTGLHAHGPEYSPAEVAWVWARLPLLSVAGLLAGLGVGMATAGLRRR